MKFICTQENLVKGLSRVTPVAGRNRQLPVLEHVLLRLQDGVLHLTCTDLELGVHTVVLGKVEGEGGCTVVARTLVEYVQQLPPAQPVTLELKGGSLHVTTKGFRAQFPVSTEDDFPLLPTPSKGSAITLAAAQFSQALTRTLFAAARDDTRPEIHSVFVRGEKKAVVTAATDSFRLAEDVVPVQKEGKEFSFLLPLATAQEVVRLFSSQESVVLQPDDSHILFQGEGVELSSRLVEGTYPDYRQIIPQSFTTRGEVDREELIRALKTLLVFLPRDSRRVQVVVQPGKGRCRLSVGGGESGQGAVELDFDGEGEDLEILFNIQYLLEGLPYVAGERVGWRLIGSGDPALLAPLDKEAAYTYVVMPIQAD